MTVAPQETIGRNEVTFREQNEEIEATAHRALLLGSIPFICECPDLECAGLVRLTCEEYEAVRVHPRRFFNLPGHETESVAAGAEVALTIYGAYTVVEKIGVAGEIAESDRAYT